MSYGGLGWRSAPADTKIGPQVVQGMGLCQPCTDVCWKWLAWLLRDDPLPLDPKPAFMICDKCQAGWLGRELLKGGFLEEVEF